MECGEASGILHKEIRIAKENIMQQSMKSQKNALDWKARKKGDSDFDIDRPPNIAEKYSISCLFILAVP